MRQLGLAAALGRGGSASPEIEAAQARRGAGLNRTAIFTKCAERRRRLPGS